MADLVTTIAADDREFRQGLGRVDARLTSFAGSVRGISSIVKGAAVGFGALGAAKAFVSLAESVHRVWEEAEAARTSLERMGQAGVDAGRARERSLSGAPETDQDIRDEAERQIKEMRDAANKERVRLAGLSWLDRKYYEAATGKTPDEASKELEASTTENDKRIRAQAERTVKARQDKERRDYWDAKHSADLEYKNFQRDRRSNLNDLRDGMTDEKIGLLDGAGLGNAADTARLQERLRRKLEEIDQNEMFSPAEKRISRDFYEEAFGANKRLLDEQSMEGWRSKAKSFQGNIGGATFQQQLADIQRPLNTVAEEIRDQVINCVRRLDDISAKAGSPAYGA